MSRWRSRPANGPGCGGLLIPPRSSIDHPLRDPAYGGHLGLRVHTVAAYGLSDALVEIVEQRGVSVGKRESYPVPVPSEVPAAFLTRRIRTWQGQGSILWTTRDCWDLKGRAGTCRGFASRVEV